MSKFMTFRVGAVVHLHPTYASAFPVSCQNVTYKVVKQPVGLNGVNYLCEPVDGGVGLRARGMCLQAGPAKKSPARPTMQKFQPSLMPGTLVTVGHIPGLWVVCAITAKGHRIFPLGGSNRYYRNIERSALTVRSIANITEKLAPASK